MDFEDGSLRVVGIGLDRLGRLVVELAEKVSPAHGTRSVENVGIAV